MDKINLKTVQSVVGVNPWESYVEKWSKGCGSSTCAKATRICLARGKIPSDVLMVGEAPGESEDVIGQPFVGIAGHLLDQIVRKALPAYVRVAFTNIVCCIPRTEDGRKATEPDAESIEACSLRLKEFINLCNPKLIVCVGKQSRDWTEIPPGIASVGITHPSSILRANLVQKGLMVQRAVVNISTSWYELH